MHSGRLENPRHDPELTVPETVLVVDLDGTLTRTDTLVESLLIAVRHRPLAVAALFLHLGGGRAHFKEGVADLAGISPASLPWREDLIEYIQSERARGRRIALATAAHESIAQGVAQHLGLFDDVLCTRNGVNLKGEAKLAAIREKFGAHFCYAGDSKADRPIWQAATRSILVGPAVKYQQTLGVTIERTFADSVSKPAAWMRALRPHQWLKNLLIFVPLLTAFAFSDLQKLLFATLVFAAFCMAASATYLINDLMDVSSDRLHPRKKTRPFARGDLPLPQGLGAAVLLLGCGIATASLVSTRSMWLVAGYFAITTLYSSVIKRIVVLDVLTLAMLYTWRVLAGAVAISVVVSPWLFAFSTFTFMGLALVKRCSELVALQAVGGKASFGRDYSVNDLPVLWPLGIGASLCSVVVFGLYIGALQPTVQYASRELLWLDGLLLLYWTARMWIKTVRGQMHDDPILFALKDPVSLATVTAMVLTAVVAHSFSLL